MFIEFFLENLSWRFILWNFDSGDFSIEVFKILNEDLFIGDFSYEDLFIGGFSLKNWGLFFLKSYLEDLSFEHLKIFKEDFFMEIFPLKYGDFCLKIHSGDFSIAILKIFIEDLFIGDFSLKNSFGDFSFDDLNIFNEDLWRFFLEIFPFEDLYMEIFPWRFILEIFPLKFWKFLKRFDHGDFSFGIWFWRFFLWKMEIFPFEDLFVEIFP